MKRISPIIPKKKPSEPQISVKERIQQDDEFAVGCMFFLQSCQDLDEQLSDCTINKNGIGWSGTDAGIMGRFCKFYEETGFLTPRQMEVAKKILVKYSKTQLHLNIESKPIKKRESKSEEKKADPSPSQPKSDKTAEIESDGEIKIRFKYDPIMVAKIKTLRGRRFNNNVKSDPHWSAPVMDFNIKKLMEMGFELGPKLQSKVSEKKAQSSPEANSKLMEKINNIPGLKVELRQYQKDGVAFLEKRNGRALIGDDMGVGKTLQALAYLQLHPEIRPAVIIAPATAKLNFAYEIQKTTSIKNFEILSGGKPYPITEDIVIINYDILNAKKNRPNTLTHFVIHLLLSKLKNNPRILTIVNFLLLKIFKAYNIKKPSWKEELIKLNPKIIIMDECHRIANKTKRTDAIKDICKGVKHIIGMTGTPIKNRPMEAFNILNLLDKSTFNNRVTYGIRYCDGVHNGYGWDFTGSSNESELNELLTNPEIGMMIRRMKSEVLKELPDKTRSVVPLNDIDKEAYNSAIQEFKEWCRGTWKDKSGVIRSNKDNPAVAMVELEKLKHAAARGKMKSVLEWIEEFLSSGEKLIVFTTHSDVLYQIYNKFKSVAVKLHGETSAKDRIQAMEKFQEDDKIRLFVGNVKAAGESITLTASSNVAFIEFPWTPAEVDQAEDRAWRQGQKNAVTSYYLIGQGTIELDIIELIDEKRKVIGKVIDNKEIEEKNMVSELMNRILRG